MLPITYEQNSLPLNAESPRSNDWGLFMSEQAKGDGAALFRLTKLYKEWDSAWGDYAVSSIDRVSRS